MLQPNTGKSDDEAATAQPQMSTTAVGMQLGFICGTCEHGRVLDVSGLLLDAHAPTQRAILIQCTLVAPPATCTQCRHIANPKP